MKYLNILIILCLTIISCSSLDVHIDKKDLKKPNKILIGYFENRNLKFDPYITENLRDNLLFEFYKKGYVTELLDLNLTGNPLKDETPTDKIDKSIENHMKQAKADLFIQGVISIREIGDFLNTKTSTSIIIQLYNSEGYKIGELLYITSKKIADASVLKGIAVSVADKIHAELPH